MQKPVEQDPLVSITIPNYNHAQYVGDAILERFRPRSIVTLRSSWLMTVLLIIAVK